MKILLIWTARLVMLLALNPAHADTLAQARAGFTTTMTQKLTEGDAPAPPPADLFQLVSYPSPAGDLAAYVSPAPKDGKKHPVIIWLVGGMSNGIGDTAWAPAEPANDQSASAYREAGIMMMYPSRRGGNNNPGYHEDFYGEADDIMAARRYLERRDDIDPARIYLGGHSTGGTLALLVAEMDPKFRDVFAFGPVDKPTRYGSDSLHYDVTNLRETDLRSPIEWLQDIAEPTFILEGTASPSNLACLVTMQKISTNPRLHFIRLVGKTHFTGLAPANKVIAAKIVADTGDIANISFTDDELGNPPTK